MKLRITSFLLVAYPVRHGIVQHSYEEIGITQPCRGLTDVCDCPRGDLWRSPPESVSSYSEQLSETSLLTCIEVVWKRLDKRAFNRCLLCQKAQIMWQL